MAEGEERAGTAGREPAGARDAQADGEAPRHGRARTCVGCGERVPLGAPGDALPLVRLILGPGGVIAVDPGDGGFGRGAHVHPRPDCLTRAVQRGLARAAKGRVHAIYVDPESAASEALSEGVAPPEGRVGGEAPSTAPALPAALTPASLARAIRQAMDRRVEGLVRAAVRSRAVAIGADAASDALRRGAGLALVACDAAAGADVTAVQQAVAAGRGVAWGSKQALGVLAGGRREQGVAVMAIEHGRIAAAIAEAVRTADACAAVERGEAGPGPGQRGPGGRGSGRRGPEGRGPGGRGPGRGPEPEKKPGPAESAGGSERTAPSRRQPRGQARDEKSLQHETPRRMDEGGKVGRRERRPADPETSGRDPAVPGGAPGVSRDGTGPGAAAKRGPRGWARRTGNVERGA